jgi:hypothetical protein
VEAGVASAVVYPRRVGGERGRAGGIHTPPSSKMVEKRARRRIKGSEW